MNHFNIPPLVNNTRSYEFVGVESRPNKPMLSYRQENVVALVTKLSGSIHDTCKTRINLFKNIDFTGWLGIRVKRSQSAWQEIWESSFYRER